MDKERKFTYNLRVFRLILVEGFTIEEMHILAADLCGNHELIFSKDSTLEKLALDLLNWCNRHCQLNKLADLVKARNLNAFEKHQSDLEKPDSSSEGFMADMQASSSNIQEAVDQLRIAGNVSKSEESKDTIQEDQGDHPLSGDQAAVRHWFRDELSIDQQAFVISAALFDGLQRYDLMEITSVVRDLIIISSNDKAQEKRSETITGEKEIFASKENVVNLKISLNNGIPEGSLEKEAGKKRGNFIEDEGILLDLANLRTETATRNTEGGETMVHIIQFRDEAQRQKILQLLANHFTGIIWKLVPFIRTLGAHPRIEIRARTARTAGELLREVDFIRIKDELLIPWALSPSMNISINVGIALEEAIKNEQYIVNIKNLLKHWVTSSNPDLNWTALASYIQLCNSWPKEAVDAIESAIRKETNLSFLPLCFYITRELCKNGQQEEVIRRIAEWMREEKSENNLRFGAALIFIDAIDFSFLAKEPNLLDKEVEIFKTGLSDRTIDNLGIIRSGMLDKLRCWAEESFEKDPQEELGILFTRLFLRSDERGKERIKFFLQKWYRTADHKPDKRSSEGFKKIISDLPE